jgi:diacylglycerol kinase
LLGLEKCWTNRKNSTVQEQNKWKKERKLGMVVVATTGINTALHNRREFCNPVLISSIVMCFHSPFRTSFISEIVVILSELWRF